MKIKAIFFDIDNTLFPSKKFAELARRNAINKMIENGLEAEPEKAYQALLRVIEKYGSNYPYHFDALLEELGVKRNPRIIAAGISAYHDSKASILPFPEVPKTIITLRDAGYKLYVASEGNSIKQWDKLIRLELHHFFEGVFVSEDVGYEKSPEFFLTILKKLHLQPQEAMMVGDKIDKDIEPAKEAGMITVEVVREGEVERNSNADYKIDKIDKLLKILEV